tara:strand:+ start:450 stop:707 length:258 start_codon:yes stop_codon:yes gene_type:complete
MKHWTSNLIRELRLARGWSLFDLSIETDIPRQTISYIESGEHAANIFAIERCLEALDHEIEVVPMSGIGEAHSGEDNRNGQTRKR